MRGRRHAPKQGALASPQGVCASGPAARPQAGPSPPSASLNRANARTPLLAGAADSEAVPVGDFASAANCHVHKRVRSPGQCRPPRKSEGIAVLEVSFSRLANSGASAMAGSVPGSGSCGRRRLALLILGASDKTALPITPAVITSATHVGCSTQPVLQKVPAPGAVMNELPTPCSVTRRRRVTTRCIQSASGDHHGGDTRRIS